MTKRYLINEIFYSIQGEGGRAGTANVFVRFAKCNLACNVAEHGFDCDTDFEHGDWYTLNELLEAIGLASWAHQCRWVVFTGGEPALQLDQPLVDAINQRDWQAAIETNGTRPLPAGISWTCVSPKPGTNIVVPLCSEVKVVLAAGQQPPDHLPDAFDYLVSPAFKGDDPDPDAIAWCVQWVLDHPNWRLSCQQHKWWGIR